jgi:hypothetical protein
MKPFSVLTVDGGGTRGLYAALLLKNLTELFNSNLGKQHDLGKKFDLVCGTSTGAIIACGLASGLTCEQIAEIYIDQCPAIFPSPKPEKKKKLLWWALKHRIKPPADSSALMAIMEEHFGDLTLNDVYEKRNVAIALPSINGLNHQPVVLRSPKRMGQEDNSAMRVVDACMASAAAPVFFPAFAQYPGQTFIDGGLWANNPVLLGMTEALALAKPEQPIEIISISTCQNLVRQPSEYSPEKGLVDWLENTDLMEITMTANGYGSQMLAEEFAQAFNSGTRKVSVVRLQENNKTLETFKKIKIDKMDAEAIQTMRTLAEADAALNYKLACQDGNEKYSSVRKLFTV